MKKHERTIHRVVSERRPPQRGAKDEDKWIGRVEPDAIGDDTELPEDGDESGDEGPR
jgi:hypothetical protein